VSHLPLTRVRLTEEGKTEAVPVALWEVLFSLQGKRMIEVNNPKLFLKTDLPAEEVLLGTQINTETEEVFVAGPPFNRALLVALLDLAQDGIKCFETDLFWFDRSSASIDDTYSFFAVNNDKIVREFLSFRDGPDSGFDRSLFELNDEKYASEWREARIRFWYRKFYRETRVGQLMVLRPDEPELHYFPEARWRSDVAFDVLQGRVLWALGLLALCAGLLALCTAILLFRR
jgi:hypothetical protein